MADLVPGGRGAEKPRVFLWEAGAACVRVVGSAAAPLFVGKDVCDALGYTKYRDALALIDADERESSQVDTLGGPQEMTCVTESGFYALAFGSRKEQARVFRKWVTSEVLPQIRKTGAYAVPVAPKVPELPFARGIVEIYHRAQLPEAIPSEQECVCRLLGMVLGERRENIVVHGSTLYDVAEREAVLVEWFGDHRVEWQRRGRFLHRLRRHAGRWLSCDVSGRFFWVASVGFGRARRYQIAVRHEPGVVETMIVTPGPEAVNVVARALRAGGEVVVK